jgi:F-type H+-transporting ATPase subunit beta
MTTGDYLDSGNSFGTVVSVRGSVLDVRSDGRLPSIFSVLHASEHQEIIAEVLEQLDGRRVRAIALTPTASDGYISPISLRSVDAK